MNILALDTSSRAGSVAFWEGDDLRCEVFLHVGNTHSETALPLVEQTLALSQRSLDDVDLLALSVGPGSFTGLRIGIALAKGLAFRRQLPCAPVSTLEGLAYNLAAVEDRLIVPVMDARRSQVYTGAFRFEKGELVPVWDDQILLTHQLEEKLKETPGGRTPLFVGDGAALCIRAMGERLTGAQMAPPHLLHQRSSSIGLAARRLVQEEQVVTADQLVPAYLRIPQAQRELEEQQSHR